MNWQRKLLHLENLISSNSIQDKRIGEFMYNIVLEVRRNRFYLRPSFRNEGEPKECGLTWQVVRKNHRCAIYAYGG